MEDETLDRQCEVETPNQLHRGWGSVFFAEETKQFSLHLVDRAWGFC
jgi:alpha-D-ribose 1-methylphosphonate 5-triphosphate synthase subunit PhnI